MSPSFLPSHAAPDGGLPAWAVPDPTQPAVATIDARVEMQVMERTGDWARIVCSNGWSAWVDARRLVSLTAPPATAPTAMAGTAAKRRLALGPHDLVPAGLVLTASFLPWIRVRNGSSSNSFDVALMFLFQLRTTSTDLKLGFLLLATAVALAIPGQPKVRRIAAGVVISVCGLYLVQLQRLLSENPGAPSLTSIVGLGVLVAAAGAAAALLWKPAQ